MPFLDFFRNFFNKGGIQELPQNSYEQNQQYQDSFRNPIWQSDEDEEDVNDFRHSMNKYNFRIDSNPFEMTRFFENQMELLIRSFFSFDSFGKNLGDNTNIFNSFSDDIFTNTFSIPDRRSNNIGPRDEVMKPEYGTTNPRLAYDDFTNIFSLPDVNPNNKGLYNSLMKPSYQMPDSNTEKVDSDLDGKIKSDDLAKLWTSPTPESVEPQFPLNNFHFGKSVSTQIIKRQDGSIEERRTVRDSIGNEETSVTRQIGDKKHTLITKRAKDGSEEQTENIINMDENELNGFHEKWLGYSKSLKKTIKNFEDDFPFGPNPKL